MTEDAVDPAVPEAANVDPPTTEVTKAALEKLTKAELAETYGLDEKLKHAELVDAAVEKLGIPAPDDGEVVLVVPFPITYHDDPETGIRVDADPGTIVPAKLAKGIIARAAVDSNIEIREVS